MGILAIWQMIARWTMLWLFLSSSTSFALPIVEAPLAPSIPLTSSSADLFVFGHLEPYPLVWVSPPLDGAMTTQLVPYGAAVQEGQLLFQWSHPSFTQWLEQNALSLEAQKKRVADLRNPEQQEGLLQAHYHLTQTERALARACLRLEQSNALFELGLISGEERLRDEEGCVSQKEARMWAVRRTDEIHQELNTTSLGEVEQRLQKLMEEQAELKHLATRMHYYAPVPGALWPISDKEAALWKTAPIALIADANRAFVSFRLDEFEVAKLSSKLCMFVSIPALGLEDMPAELLGVDPIPSFEPNGLALYEVRGVLTLPKEIAWRIGYSVQARICAAP